MKGRKCEGKGLAWSDKEAREKRERCSEGREVRGVAWGGMRRV